MDRAINYDAEQPQTLDVLVSNKVAMIGLAFASRAMFSDGPAIQGFACTQTQPAASLNVVIGPGAIYAIDTVDATAYGDLGTDGATICKQGISYLSQTFATPAPGTAGQSINYLIEVALQDVDTGSKQVAFYNGGAAPTFQTKNTVRQVLANVQIKAGTAATTGTQTTPSPDAGYTGVWVITVANGQTTVTASNISLITSTIKDVLAFPNLPSIPPDMQQSVWTYWPDTGAVNTLSVTPYPPIIALTAGYMLFVKVANTNTGAVTLAINSYNGTITKNVKRNNGNALVSGDLQAGGIYALIYDGTQWQTLNFFGVLSSTQVNRFNVNQSFGVDHGTPNHLVLSPTPPITSIGAGTVVIVLVANANTGATDMTVNMNAAVPVIEHGQPLDPIAVTPGEIIHTINDGTSSHKIPKRSKFFTFDEASPPSVPYNLVIGDTLAVTFENATSIPLWVAPNGGLYSLELVVYANSSTFSLVRLTPNDVGLTGAIINSWYTAFYDNPTGADPFDLNSTGDATFENVGGWGGFLMRTFSRRGDLDDGWGGGPFMLHADITTLTTSKGLRYQSGIFGSPAAGYQTWTDTTTAWTSLGTIQVSGAAPPLSSTTLTPLATLSGVALVKRNA